MKRSLGCLAICLALGMGGCDDEDVIAAAAKKGIFLQKKTVEEPLGSGKMIEKFVVVNDPTKSPVDNALSTARDVAGGVPIAAQVIGGLTILSSLVGNLLQKRLQAIADRRNAELQTANDQHEATHDATSLGLQAFVNSQPAAVGVALKQHLDDVHDHMEVPPEHQDWIQPTTKAA